MSYSFFDDDAPRSVAMGSGIDLVKSGVAVPRHWSTSLLWSIAAVVVPILLRWAIDGGANGFPFATFLPTLLWVSIFLDWRFAVLTAFGSFLAVAVFFVEPTPLAEFTWQRGALFLLYLLTVGSMILTGHLLRRAVIDLQRRSAEADAFNAELQHRARNALQIVKALASRASKTTDPADFYKTLGGRITALIKANELLGIRSVASCELTVLVAAAMEPFSNGQIAWSGPSCRVGREAGNPLIMALHELATNAAKYGALSVDEGRVALEWTLARDEICIVWRESGGPAVQPPTVRGLGSRILSAQGGLRRAKVDYDPSGVRCELVVEADG